MSSLVIYVSAKCPICKKRTDIPFTRVELHRMLRGRAAILLYSSCHNQAWDASEAERVSLRELLLDEASANPGQQPEAARSSSPASWA
jgi:hypothetical protein